MPFWTFVWDKLGQRNHINIALSSFTRDSVFNFSVHNETQNRQIHSSGLKSVSEKPRRNLKTPSSRDILSRKDFENEAARVLLELGRRLTFGENRALECFTLYTYNKTVLVRFGDTSGWHGKPIVRILARRSAAKITMARPNEPDMPPRRTRNRYD